MKEYFKDLIDEYLKKINEEDPLIENSGKKRTVRKIKNSWIKKDLYRKKLRKAFYSMDPGMDKDSIEPLYCLNAIWIDTQRAMEGGPCSINHVNHVYMTKRGNFEKFRGAFEKGSKGSVFGMACKDRTVSSVTNRRIRHMRISEEETLMKYSEYKKMFGPKDYGIL